MTDAGRQVTAGRVGRAHGLDGSFYLDHPSEPLVVGTEVEIAGRRTVIERRAGTDERPIVRVSGVGDRDAAGGLRGEPVLVAAGALEEGEYFTDDLVGCEIPGVGSVRRVISGPSCDVLEVGDSGLLVPFVSDAIKRVDPEGGIVEIDRHFLGLDAESE